MMLVKLAVNAIKLVLLIVALFNLVAISKIFKRINIGVELIEHAFESKL